MKALLNTRILTAAALIAAVNFSNSASAGQAQDTMTSKAGVITRSVTIPYTPAEAATDRGRAALYGKIRHAAREVCGPAGLREAGSLSASIRNRKCYREAVDAAVSQVGYDQLAGTGR